MNQNKKNSTSNHQTYYCKKSIRQIQVKQSKNSNFRAASNKDKKSQPKIITKPKTKQKTTKIQHLKTHEPQPQQGLPYVKRPNQKRNFKNLANLTSNLRGISKLDFNDTEYLTQKYQNQAHQSKYPEFIKKSLQQNQKTIPIATDQSNNSTAETTNLIKQIIAKSRSRAMLNNPFYQTIRNEQSNSTSVNRKHSQSQNRGQRSQQKISQKKSQAYKYLQKQSHKNIRSCKQIQLFRISSKKNLVLDRQNEQSKIRSIKSIQKKQESTQDKQLQSSKSSRYGYGILSQKQQCILKTLIQTKKSSQLQIKQNVSHNTNTLPSLHFQFDQKNISQIKQIEIQISDKDEYSQLSMPSIDCSVICENQQQFSQSSFLNDTAKQIMHNFNSKQDLKTLIDINGIHKRAIDYKNRKKILEVDKLRKKFPTDFFKN